MRNVITLLALAAALLWLTAIVFPLTGYPVGLGGVFVMSMAGLLVSIESYRNGTRLSVAGGHLGKKAPVIRHFIPHLVLGLFFAGAIPFILWEMRGGWPQNSAESRKASGAVIDNVPHEVNSNYRLTSDRRETRQT